MEETDNNKESSKSEGLQRKEVPPPEGFREADDYYFNDNGFVVFTAKYLLERGYCCGNGCKNCPYDYKAVPEPKRSKLLADRNKNESTDNAS
jgi:hypothetical protein